MATRSRRGQKQSREDEEEQQDELVSLEFNETLSWRAGKPLGANVLAPRLERLSKELMDLDQETTDKDSLSKIAKELASLNLIQHRDKGVKALTAVCLVDILRICAPAAPFTEQQLKEIFTLLIRHILPALSDPSASYHTQHKYVLTSLTEVQSILLLNDIHQADELLVQLFSNLFDTVSTVSSKSPADGVAVGDIEYQATEMLSCVVDESSGLPAKVVDVIMAQFLRAASPRRDKTEPEDGQSTLEHLKEVPAAYSMAAAICTRCFDKMSRYVGQYFSEVICESAGLGSKSNGHRPQVDEGENADAGPSEEDLHELRKAHQLVRELWRAAPQVMVNVVPQLEQELSADDVAIRQLATETLGDIIAGIGAAGPPQPPALDPLQYPSLKMSDETSLSESSALTRPIALQAFTQAHNHVFRSFMTRRNDKSAAIRSCWTSAIGNILSTKAGGTGLNSHDQADMVTYLGEKLNDPDEKVRLAGVKAIESFSLQDIVTLLASSGGVDTKNSVLCSLADRGRDKKPPVRVEATILMAKLWAVAAGELAAGDEAVTAAFSGIPSRIFNAYYANDQELNMLLDRAIFEYLIPLGFPRVPSKPKSKQSNGSQAAASFDPDKIRAERILLLVRSLDSHAKTSLHAMHAKQPQFSKVVTMFINLCETFNGGVVEDKASEAKTRAHLLSSAQYLARFLPDPEKAQHHLMKFTKLHDRRNYQLVRFAVSIESDFKTAHRAIKELTKRLRGDNQSKSNATLLETFLPLLYRSSCLIFNRSYLSTFMDHSRNAEDAYSATAHEILNEISNRNPDLFKTHAGALHKDIQDHAPNEDGESHPGVVESLKAYSSYSQKYPEDVPQERKFVQALVNHALYGPIKSSKFVVNIILANENEKSKTNATHLLQNVMEDWEYGSPFFLNRMATIAQLELLAPDVTLDVEDQVLDMTLKQIVLNNRIPASHNDPEFVEDLSQSEEELQAKVLALKINVNRILGMTDLTDAKEKGMPVFKLLRNILNKSGELSKDPSKPTPKHHQARLRLAAAKLYLKLCTNSAFDDLLSPSEFNLLAYTTQDPQPMVRRGLIERLQKYLSLGKLKHRFYTPIFLAAYEPNKDLKASVETWIRSRIRFFNQKGHLVLESIMGRLISLLAHHPDFDPEELLSHAKYLVFYVTMIATQDNIGMIYKYAERVKQTKDAIDPAKSENIYVICDLAMAVIRRWQEKNSWVFQAYSDKIGLPKGLYSGLPGHSAAQEISEKQFIPDGLEETLDDLLVKKPKKKRKSVDGHGAPPPKKVKLSGSREKSGNVSKAKVEKMKKTKSRKVKLKSKEPQSTRMSPSMRETERRRSGRARAAEQSYIERDSSEDDEEMLQGVAEWTYEDNSEAEGSDASDRSSAGSDGSNLSDAPGSGSGSDAMDEDEAEKKEEDEDMKDVEEQGRSSRLLQKRTSAPALAPANGRQAMKKATAKNDSNSDGLSDSLEEMEQDKSEPEPEPEPKRETRAISRRGSRPAPVNVAERKRSKQDRKVTASERKPKANNDWDTVSSLAPESEQEGQDNEDTDDEDEEGEEEVVKEPSPSTEISNKLRSSAKSAASGGKGATAAAAAVAASSSSRTSRRITRSSRR